MLIADARRVIFLMLSVCEGADIMMSHFTDASLCGQVLVVEE